MYILIAEDDPAVSLALGALLEDLGHESVVETTTEQAWDRIHEDRFSILISEWSSQRIDGRELCRRVRSRSSSGYVYFLCLTAKSGPDQRADKLSAGADDFLSVPIDSAELAGRLDIARRVIALKSEVQNQAGQMERLIHQVNQQHMLLGNILLAQGAISAGQLREALDEQAGSQRPLGEVLVAHGWTTEEQIVAARSVQMDVPYVAVSKENPDETVLSFVDREIARRYKVLPLSIEAGDETASGRLRLAMVDPYDAEAIEAVQKTSRRRVLPSLAGEAALLSAIERCYDETADGPGRMGAENSGAARTVEFDREALLGGQEGDPIDHGNIPIARYVHLLFEDAIRRRATGIHFEAHKRDCEVLYRIDGDPHSVRVIPRHLQNAAATRIKILAEMDVNERQRPAEGRLSAVIDGRGVEIRVSTLPTQYGERMSLRLLDRQSACFSIDQLGFLPENRAAFRSVIEKNHGLIVVSGPGKSGRTTTLYAALNALKVAGHGLGGSRKTIITCEETIEYELDGISQSPVNTRAGLSPAAHLQAILDQDPDVVMIGDLRDAAMAETACRAGLMGFRVFASIEAGEAAEVPGRLMAMGVPPYLVAGSLAGIVSQRLVRKLCPACRRESVPEADTISYFRCLNVKIPHVMRLHEAVGCDRCDKLGMHGRLAVQEILPADRHLQHLVTERAEVEKIRQSAVDSGMIPMITDGLNKVCHGLTTLREVQARVGDGLGLRTLYAAA